MLYWLSQGRYQAYEPDSGLWTQGLRPGSSSSQGQVNSAGDIMSAPVMTIAASDTLLEAHDTMRQLGVSHLAVVDQGQFAGLLSDRDILRATDPGDLVGRHMSCQLLLASPKDSIRELAFIMVRHHIHCVPILDENVYLVQRPVSSSLPRFPDVALVGILTTSDILKCMTCQATLDFWCY